MKTLNLKMNKLYILSGLPGSGKSTFLDLITEKSMILSSDKIRLQIQPLSWEFRNGEIEPKINESSNELVFSIIKDILSERMKFGLTTFIDATNLTDKDRSKFVKIAEEFNMETEILIFDIDVKLAKERNFNRDIKVPEYVIDNMNLKFERTSKYHFKLINSDFLINELNFIPNTIPNNEDIDFIGDIHGLYDELLLFLKELGYVITNTSISHPNDRKLCFLGDFIDRGKQSLEVIDLVHMAVNNGHYAIIGNHEAKLIRSYSYFKNDKVINGGIAGKITLVDLLRKKEKYQKRVISFLKSLPFYYTYKNNLIVHANIEYGEPLFLSREVAIYGSKKRDDKPKDTDLGYQELFNATINRYSLIRGHIAQISEQLNVMSLEEGQAYAGYLVAARYNKGLFSSKERFKSSFNFSESLSNDKNLINFSKLIDNKLVTNRFNENYSLLIYKYSKQVFFKNRWNEDPLLLKARGIVTDLAGRIVQHPFDKVFNYRENGAGLDIPEDKEVIAVEKMNGFLGNIGLDPFTKKLLITTIGSFDSDFVGYIKDFIDHDLEIKLLKFLNQNPMTLSFEVIHPEDPHIIKYNEENMGLWLIGARKLSFMDKSEPEEFLDYLAKDLGFKRPQWNKVLFSQLKFIVKNSKREGYMVRDNNEEQLTLLKFKTPFYLLTKFLGRLSESKIKFMYSSPNKFKQSLDEEFYLVVDRILESFSESDFLNMDNNERVSKVRPIIEKLQS